MLIHKYMSVGSIVAVAGLTMATTVFAANKVASSLRSNPQNITVPELKESAKTEVKPNAAESNEKPNTMKKAETTPPSPSSTQSKSAKKTAAQCVVTLFGQKYDVSSLRSTHPGGNVFVCNTDMTATYKSQHGTNMSRMARYALSADGTSPAASVNNSGSGDVTSGDQSMGREDTEVDDMSENESGENMNDGANERKRDQSSSDQNKQSNEQSTQGGK